MKNLLCIMLSIILIACVLCGCAGKTTSTTPPSEPSTVNQTKSEHIYKNMTFEAPDDWIINENEYGYYLYSSGDFMYISTYDISQSGIDSINKNGITCLPDEAYDYFLSGILDGFEPNADIEKDEELFFDNRIYKHFIVKGNLSSTQVHASIYITNDEGYVYTISFISYGENSNPSFAATEQSIIQSIRLKAVEAPTVMLTEIPTEEPTNPPQKGKSDFPAPLGEEIEIFDSDRTVLQMSISNIIDGDEAYSLIKSYNQFNSDPPEGYHYVLFDVNVSCTETQALNGFRISETKFCAANSTKAILPLTSSPAVLDNELNARLLNGSSTTGQCAVFMPDDGGYIIYDERYFFALS